MQGASRNRAKERLTDVLVVVAALALSMTVALAETRGLSVYPRLVSPGLTSFTYGLLPLPVFVGSVADDLLLVAGSALLFWRRRWPVGIAICLVLMATVTPLIPAALIALFTVAALRSIRETWALTALALAPLPLYCVLHRPSDTATLAGAVTGAVLVGGAVGWGLFVRGMHAAADQAEVQAALRAEQVRQRERESLAREMHDVLAHRLSLLSVHAGALEVNHQASREQVSEAAGVIRSSAYRAMEDLQQVLGVLRTPLQPDGARTEPPQPTLADLTHLIEQSRASGMHIDVTPAGTLAELVAVPETTGRTAYRIVQESLTNAHKHAPGQSVRIHLEGAPDEGLTMLITNAIPDSAPRGLPGSGSGLNGLKERTALIGGLLTHRRDGRTHEVRAQLPWPA
ncbi:sensor histidine kinase [Streptomyces cadmiisoli]|uniref:sensor histidine kinase n=1 Tax=Streptomyces cadmiisoli TaxID=2184053 RepID=UPI00365B4FBA